MNNTGVASALSEQIVWWSYNKSADEQSSLSQLIVEFHAYSVKTPNPLFMHQNLSLVCERTSTLISHTGTHCWSMLPLELRPHCPHTHAQLPEYWPIIWILICSYFIKMKLQTLIIGNVGLINVIQTI